MAPPRAGRATEISIDSIADFLELTGLRKKRRGDRFTAKGAIGPNDRRQRLACGRGVEIIRGLGFCLLLLAAAPTSAHADTARAAVASNFLRTMTELAAAFEARTPHRVQVSTASTGALFAQIVNGAPFDLFLAADRERPRVLVERNFAVAESRRTYARGRLVLWNGGKGSGTPACLATLKRAAFNWLAIANPVTAPYGRAAKQVLERLGLWPDVAGKLVRGGNIAQTYQFVVTGNAPLGFVARSQLTGAKARLAECRWAVPETMHDPIEQQAVLLWRGRNNAAARGFLAYLNGPDARTIIRRFGYGVD